MARFNYIFRSNRCKYDGCGDFAEYGTRCGLHVRNSKFPLVELNARIGDMGDLRYLQFNCPCACGDVETLPFNPQSVRSTASSEGKGIVWGLQSGGGIDDLNLTPSYVKPRGCELHCLIKEGTVIVL